MAALVFTGRVIQIKSSWLKLLCCYDVSSVGLDDIREPRRVAKVPAV